MKIYHLRILPGHNSMYTEKVEAARMMQCDGAYIFYKETGEQICYYPTRATIIEKIVTV